MMPSSIIIIPILFAVSGPGVRDRRLVPATSSGSKPRGEHLANGETLRGRPIRLDAPLSLALPNAPTSDPEGHLMLSKATGIRHRKGRSTSGLSASAPNAKCAAYSALGLTESAFPSSHAQSKTSNTATHPRVPYRTHSNSDCRHHKLS